MTLMGTSKGSASDSTRTTGGPGCRVTCAMIAGQQTDEDSMRSCVCLALIVLWSSVASAQAPDSGPQVFATRCASCHGTTGNGGELGPAITARIPLRSDADLEALLREGLPNAGMPAFPSLTAAERSALIAHLRT